MAKEKKKGASPVGLYLRVGPDLAMQELVRDLRQIFYVINSASYERNMHALEVSGDAADPEFQEKAELLFTLARNNGIAGIYRGDPATAKKAGADGVLVAAPELLAQAREIFGEEGIVGLSCGSSQELAARAHDENVDFVSFAAKSGGLPSPDLLRFWTILSDKPAVIEGDITNDYCAYLIKNGAAFIDSSAYIWSHGKGVMQGTVNMLHAIELGLEELEGKIQ